MPLLNDLLDFSDHPLMPPPSAQMFAVHLPAEWIQHCLTLSKHATVRLAFGFIRPLISLAAALLFSLARGSSA